MDDGVSVEFVHGGHDTARSVLRHIRVASKQELKNRPKHGSWLNLIEGFFSKLPSSTIIRRTSQRRPRLGSQSSLPAASNSPSRGGGP